MYVLSANHNLHRALQGITPMQANELTHVQALYSHMHTHAHTHTHTLMNSHVYALTHAYTHTSMHACMHTHCEERTLTEPHLTIIQSLYIVLSQAHTIII